MYRFQPLAPFCRPSFIGNKEVVLLHLYYFFSLMSVLPNTIGFFTPVWPLFCTWKNTLANDNTKTIFISIHALVISTLKPLRRMNWQMSAENLNGPSLPLFIKFSPVFHCKMLPEMDAVTICPKDGIFSALLQIFEGGTDLHLVQVGHLLFKFLAAFFS